MYLTKRQQQVLRRMLHGYVEYDFAYKLWFACILQCDTDGRSARENAAFGDIVMVSTTLRILADAELVGDFLDSDGALCYALTAKGRLLAGLLGGEGK